MLKYIATFTCLLWLSTSTNAQTMGITVEASQNITNFKFTSSDGTQDREYSPQLSGGYALGYRYNLESGLFFGLKLGMRNAGATYVLDNTDYEWNLKYFETRLNIGYAHSMGMVAPHLVLQPYYGVLLKASQRLNNEYFDIIDSGDINKSDYGLFISPGATFNVSDYISVYLDINYMLGFANLETAEGQTSNNKLMGGTVGVSFNIQ